MITKSTRNRFLFNHLREVDVKIFPRLTKKEIVNLYKSIKIAAVYSGKTKSFHLYQREASI
jgi:hypothetical protein